MDYLFFIELVIRDQLFQSNSRITKLNICQGINTGVFDYSKAGNLDDMIDDEDKEIMSKWTSEDILRYAWQATKAVADVHSVGNVHNSAAIAHVSSFIHMEIQSKFEPVYSKANISLPPTDLPAHL